MLKLQKNVCWLILLLASYGCAPAPSKPEPAPLSVVEVKPAQLSPAPAEVMVHRDANFLQRLEAIFWELDEKPTKSSPNSPPLKQ